MQAEQGNASAKSGELSRVYITEPGHCRKCARACNMDPQDGWICPSCWVDEKRQRAVDVSARIQFAELAYYEDGEPPVSDTEYEGLLEELDRIADGIEQHGGGAAW